MSPPSEGHASRRALSKIPDAYYTAGAKVLAELELDEDTFPKEVNRWFKRGVVALYREHVEQCLTHAGWNTLKMAELLGANPSLRWKWDQGKSEPLWERLFLSLAALDVTVKFLPRGRDAVVHGMTHAIEEIRQCLEIRRKLPRRGKLDDVLEAMNKVREEAAHITRVELEFLEATSRCIQWKLAQASRKHSSLLEAAAQVNEAASQHLQRHCWYAYKQIERIVHDWLEPWIVFHTTIQFDWQY